MQRWAQSHLSPACLASCWLTEQSSFILVCSVTLLAKKWSIAARPAPPFFCATTEVVNPGPRSSCSPGWVRTVFTFSCPTSSSMSSQKLVSLVSTLNFLQVHANAHLHAKQLHLVCVHHERIQTPLPRKHVRAVELHLADTGVRAKIRCNTSDGSAVTDISVRSGGCSASNAGRIANFDPVLSVAGWG